MKLYKQLAKRLDYFKNDEVEKIHEAYLTALEAHSGQERENGERYITHPVAVAITLADFKMDSQSIIAALLHDVIEDTLITKETIVTKFGQVIADIVDGLTKLNQIGISNKDETQAQSFRKMVLAMFRDNRVIIIKLADRLHNMRTLSCVSIEKRKRIAVETLDIYAPIANRLGMYKLSIELENLSFFALYPRRYRILEDAVRQVYGKHKEVLSFLEQEIHAAFNKSSLKNFKILGRTKHLYGIYRKMKNHHSSFANIMDVYAFRVIVGTVDDCYLALGIIHNLYKPLPGKFKDYIAIPKFNGYQSLHTVLFGPYGAPVEIQIRTDLMDQTANNGIAAHWMYKNSERREHNITHIHAQKWLNDLLEMQQNASSPKEFFENVKVDLFPGKVYVFTPKGGIIELPDGATAVDFAYAVHTDIGNTCIAAKINRKPSLLSTVLLNGQTVYIVTSPEAEPNPEWLNFTITAKARNCIRNYLEDKKREGLIILGKQLFDKAFSDLKIDFKTIHPNTVTFFLKKIGFKDIEDLCEDIGRGNHPAILAAYQLISSNNSYKQNKKKDVKKINSKPLLITGTQGVAINFSECCCPIPGDPIIGYLNTGYGMDIHTEDCAKLATLRRQPGKCLAVNWAKDVSGDFRVALNVEIMDKIGSLATLTHTISKAHASIDDISSGERSSRYTLLFMHILVKNLAHFERVKRYISNLPVVIGVMRKKGS